MENNEQENKNNIYITSNNQSGGITAHTVNFTKPKRELVDLEKQLLGVGRPLIKTKRGTNKGTHWNTYSLCPKRILTNVIGAFSIILVFYFLTYAIRFATNPMEIEQTTMQGREKLQR